VILQICELSLRQTPTKNTLTACNQTTKSIQNAPLILVHGLLFKDNVIPIGLGPVALFPDGRAHFFNQVRK
jgi:hypothetical protein